MSQVLFFVLEILTEVLVLDGHHVIVLDNHIVVLPHPNVLVFGEVLSSHQVSKLRWGEYLSQIHFEV